MWYIVHILLDELNIRLAIHTNPMFLLAHLAFLINNELLGVSAVEAYKLETPLALVDTIELAG